MKTFRVVIAEQQQTIVTRGISSEVPGIQHLAQSTSTTVVGVHQDQSHPGEIGRKIATTGSGVDDLDILTVAIRARRIDGDLIDEENRSHSG